MACFGALWRLCAAPGARLTAEISGRPVQDVAASLEWFCELYPELNEDLDRPAPPGILDKLREEKPGIAAWALEGARRRYRQGGFTEPGKRAHRAERH